VFSEHRKDLRIVCVSQIGDQSITLIWHDSFGIGRLEGLEDVESEGMSLSYASQVMLLKSRHQR